MTMYNPISWKQYIKRKPDQAMEMKLLALIDQYAVSQDITEMMALAEQIDLLVKVVARCQRHYAMLEPGRYVGLKCKEITLAGYCLSVKPVEGNDPLKLEFLYKVWYEHNGRNVLTSEFV